MFFSLRLGAEGLEYAPATVRCSLGDLSGGMEGLSVVGIPSVMGEGVGTWISKVEAALATCCGRIRRHQPSCILSLCILLTFAVSMADYRFAVVPVPPASLLRCQVLVMQSARAALGVPSWFPSRLLCAPVRLGGLGFPLLGTRLALCRVLHTFLAACSRNTYTRTLVCGLLHSPVWMGRPWSDVPLLHTDLQLFSLEILTDPLARLPAVSVHGEWGRCPSSAPLLVVSDGSCSGNTIGFGVVIADAQGILGEFYGGARFADASSWVAEWFAKVLGLVCLLPYGPESVLLLADNTSVVCDVLSTKSSGSYLIDCCVRFISSRRRVCLIEEGFIPAAHDTHATSQISGFQARADGLARLGGSGELPVAGIPFCDILCPPAALLYKGLVCVKPCAIMDLVYNVCACSDPVFGPLQLLPPLLGWERVLLGADVGNNCIRSAMWLRSAIFFPRALSNHFVPFVVSCSRVGQCTLDRPAPGCLWLLQGLCVPRGKS